MRLCSIDFGGRRLAGINVDGFVVLVQGINRIFNTGLPEKLEILIQDQKIEDLRRVTHNLILSDLPKIPADDINFLVPLVNFKEFWQIDSGLQGSARKILHDHFQSMFSNQDSVDIHTGFDINMQGGVGLIIGRNCTKIDEVDIPDIILGYTPFIKITNCTNENKRNDLHDELFDFFGFGPWVVTHDEVDNLKSIAVNIVVENEIKRTDTEKIPFSFIKKEVSKLSYTTGFSTGDIVLICGKSSLKIEGSSSIECSVSRLGSLKARIEV